MPKSNTTKKTWENIKKYKNFEKDIDKTEK